MLPGTFVQRMVKATSATQLRDVALYRQLVADRVFDRPVTPVPELVVSTDVHSAQAAVAVIASHLGFRQGSDGA